MIRSTAVVELRQTPQLYYVIDDSPSMLASRGRRRDDQIARAQAAAIQAPRQPARVSVGVATMTDRSLPNLVPIPDDKASTGPVQEASFHANDPPPGTNCGSGPTISLPSARSAPRALRANVKHRVAIASPTAVTAVRRPQRHARSDTFPE